MSLAAKDCFGCSMWRLILGANCGAFIELLYSVRIIMLFISCNRKVNKVVLQHSLVCICIRGTPHTSTLLCLDKTGYILNAFRFVG